MEHIKIKCREIVALGMTENKLLQYAGSAVAHSKAEIYKAVTRKCIYHDIPLLSADVNEMHGGGRGAQIGDKTVLVGSLQFMRRHGVNVQLALGLVRIFISRGHLARLVCIDGTLAGVLAFS